MRTTYTVLATMLLLSAFPSVSVAQIVVPYRAGNHVARLNHGVPVATVTPPDDGIALADPKPGIDHVLGAATLDIRDPDHPMIVFTVSNRTEAPIPPGSVDVHVASVYTNRHGEPTVNICGYMGSLQGMLTLPGSSGVGNATLAPGATVTMTVPVGPSPCLVSGAPSVGFLVHLTSNGVPALHDRVARLRRALEALRSQTQH